MPAPRPRTISDILPKIQNVAQTSNYFVKFALPNGGIKSNMRKKGINDRFILDDLGLLCHDAVLPGSALASTNTAGDYQGMIERFAHTRNFTQINLEFYVDNEYKSLKFLEHWMEYITGASSADPSSDTYHFKLTYPENYKSNDTRIVKFERNHFQFLEYRFIGLFPLSLNSTKVAYQGSQVLKASATFSFDRYVCGESSSLARDLGKAFNNISTRVDKFSQGRNKRVALSGQDKKVYNSILNQFSAGSVNNLYNSPTGQVGSTPVSTLAGVGLGAGNIIS